MESVQRLLSNITYKPGWKITAYQGRHEYAHVVITTVVPDAFQPGEMTTLDVHSRLPRVALRDPDHLYEWLLERLEVIEIHEAREFFKVNGRVYDSPHKQNADRDL